MFTRLYDLFPQVKDISKFKFPIKLVIAVEGKVKNNDGDEQFYHFSVEVEAYNPNDKEEPYTQETLEKAIKEFPALFKNNLAFYIK